MGHPQTLLGFAPVTCKGARYLGVYIDFLNDISLSRVFKRVGHRDSTLMRSPGYPQSSFLFFPPLSGWINEVLSRRISNSSAKENYCGVLGGWCGLTLGPKICLTGDIATHTPQQRVCYKGWPKQGWGHPPLAFEHMGLLGCASKRTYAHFVNSP